MKLAATEKGSGVNGTYLSFSGWPYLRTAFLAFARGLVGTEKGVGNLFLLNQFFWHVAAPHEVADTHFGGWYTRQ